MDTDRELLEWAAKAADLVATPGGDVLLPAGPATGEFRVWNPLTDDGDAFRLAVKLGLSIVHRHDFISDEPKAVAAAKWPEDYDDTETYYEGAPAAATRRAIVHAAAELGKSAHPPKGA